MTRIVLETERTRIVREDGEYLLYFDGIYAGVRRSMAAAEAAAGAWLDEQTRQLAIDEADEAAELVERQPEYVSAPLGSLSRVIAGYEIATFPGSYSVWHRPLGDSPWRFGLPWRGVVTARAAAAREVGGKVAA